jgi:hypothetical protein
MRVDSFDTVDIQYLWSSLVMVLCRQSWWYRWSFWQLRYSRTIRLKQSPGCFDDHISISNIT